MPNTRRRKFSVQNEVANRNQRKGQNISYSSTPNAEPEIKMMAQNLIAFKHNLSKQKILPKSSKNSTVAPEASTKNNKTKSEPTVDKDVTASSSNIDLFNQLSINMAEELHQSQEDVLNNTDTKQTTGRPSNQDSKRNKHPHRHRIKIRSPKRKTSQGFSNFKITLGEATTDEKVILYTCSTSVQAIDWANEVIEEAEIEKVVSNIVTQDERASTHSIDGNNMCRICHGGETLSTEFGQLISACACRGTVGRVHVKCLERWLTESGKSRCELCGTRYVTRRVHRYGLPRALVMWILSQNAKQLMVDSLGIMLMSPLAVLAAWLSGRTLAGLMTQETHITPWPLASTFVLACMTLVCYYCWIVSAATRHALGWWIWYRSQYEVRLQLQDIEE